MENVESITSFEQLEDASFDAKAILASAAAWAPNPDNPPFYLDLPFANGEDRPDITAKFKANRTLYSFEQYIPNIKKLKAIAMDAGLQDRAISRSTKKLHDLLNAHKIPHVYESYEGNHVNHIGERIQTRTLPFFSQHLSFK
jgi:enterochelin esterase-like enzyme